MLNQSNSQKQMLLKKTVRWLSRSTSKGQSQTFASCGNQSSKVSDQLGSLAVKAIWACQLAKWLEKRNRWQNHHSHVTQQIHKLLEFDQTHHHSLNYYSHQLMETLGLQGSKNVDDHQGFLDKPHIFFLVGGPGSGKGTQADRLVDQFKFKHVSTGELLREEVKRGGQLAEQISECMKEGKLVSSDLIVRLLKEYMGRHGNQRYLLDGFPRNLQNMLEFKDQIGSEANIRSLLYLNCPQEVLKERLVSRGASSGRADDNPQTIAKRLKVYAQQTQPLIQAFEEEGKCVTIDANSSVEQVYANLKATLSKAGVKPPRPAPVVLLIGDKDSTRQQQCQQLTEKYGFIHLNAKEMINDEVRRSTALGQNVEQTLQQGLTVDEGLLMELMQAKVQRENYSGRYLLNDSTLSSDKINSLCNSVSQWGEVKSVIHLSDKKHTRHQRLQNPSDEHQEFNDLLTQIEAEEDPGKVTQEVIDHLNSIGLLEDSSDEKLIFHGLKVKDILGNYFNESMTQDEQGDSARRQIVPLDAIKGFLKIRPATTNIDRV